jgi:hypothetical protein
MSSNKSQIGITPFEALFEDNNNKSNIDQQLSVEIITTSQSLVQFSTINMIPNQTELIHNIQEHNTLTRRQQNRRRRRQRQRQRRRQHREEQQRRQRQRQQQQQQQQQPQQQARSQQFRGWFEQEWDHDNWEHLGFPEFMEENMTPILEAYDWEKMDPKDRSEQQQLNELEQFMAQEQLALIEEEIEQLHQTEVVQKLQEEEQQQRDNEQLIQLEQWETIAFQLQQLNET